jgi:hypothetical protein
VAIGVGVTWLGVLLSYDSYYWVSDHNAVPVSSLIVGLVFVAYLLSGLPPIRRLTGRQTEMVITGAEEAR